MCYASNEGVSRSKGRILTFLHFFTPMRLCQQAAQGQGCGWRRRKVTSFWVIGLHLGGWFDRTNQTNRAEVWTDPCYRSDVWEELRLRGGRTGREEAQRFTGVQYTSPASCLKEKRKKKNDRDFLPNFAVGRDERCKSFVQTGPRHTLASLYNKVHSAALRDGLGSFTSRFSSG